MLNVWRMNSPKGTTINDLGGGPEEIEQKKISEALLQEKINLQRPSPGKINFKRPSPGKNQYQEAFSRKKLFSKGIPAEKINPF